MDSGVESYDESNDATAMPFVEYSNVVAANNDLERNESVSQKRIFDLMERAANISSIRATSRSSSSSSSRSSLLSSKRARRLRVAAHVNNVNLAKQLLRSGVDVNSSDEQGRTALHLASSKGFVEVVDLLLRHQADPDLKDRLGNTPLHLAVCTNHVEVVTQLLRGGTNVFEVDRQGRTALQLGLQMATSKLKWIQKNRPGPPEMDQVKSEMAQVLDLMNVYVTRRGSSDWCADLISGFSQRLSLHQTHEELSSDLQSLLQSLNGLQV